MSGVKLMATRAKVGTYGRVAAKGIIEVDAHEAEKLVASGGFTRATAEDVEAAQARQKAFLVSLPDARHGFPPLSGEFAAAREAEAAEKAKAEAEAAEKAKASKK